MMMEQKERWILSNFDRKVALFWGRHLYCFINNEYQYEHYKSIEQWIIHFGSCLHSRYFSLSLSPSSCKILGNAEKNAQLPSWNKNQMYMPITVTLWYETEWWLYFISVFNFQSFFLLSLSLSFLSAVFHFAVVCLCLTNSWTHSLIRL